MIAICFWKSNASSYTFHNFKNIVKNCHLVSSHEFTCVSLSSFSGLIGIDECKVESMEPNYLQNSLFSLEENFELRVQKKNGGKSEGAECTRQGGK